MAAIRTNAAAHMLGVSPNTLRSWERRFGYPRPARSQGGHRQYELREIESLRDAFAETQNVSSAIALARERGEGPSSAPRLAAALARFEEDRANRLLEESLALRSVEHTVETVLIPAVGVLLEAGSTPEGEFAWRHATGWLCSLRRLAPPATRPEGILIFDASAPGELDSLHVQGLELAVRRAGLRTLVLSVGIEPARLGRALRALAPEAAVFVGHRAALDTIARLVYALRQGGRAVEVLDYGGALPDTGASTVRRLGGSPVAARDALLAGFAHPARVPDLEPRVTALPRR